MSELMGMMGGGGDMAGAIGQKVGESQGGGGSQTHAGLQNPYAGQDRQVGMSQSQGPTDMMDYAMKAGLLGKLSENTRPQVRGLLDPDQLGMY